MSKASNGKDLLGRGIRSLLQNIDADLKTTEGNLKPKVVDAATHSVRVPLARIETNKKNPRKDFDPAALEELAASIKIHDIIQPLTVSKLGNDRYQLIAGERRFRAAKIAGLTDVPVYLRQADDAEILELALLENLQREDLNAMEVSFSYKRMMDELGYSQEKVAERMGKDRTTVTNYIRLLKLPPDIQLSVRKSEISMAHARTLLSLEHVDQQLVAFKTIMSNALNVRQTEKLVKEMLRVRNEQPSANKEDQKLPPAFQRIKDHLSSHFSTGVKMSHHKNGQGSITLEYYSLQELNHLLDKMQVQVG